MSSRKLVAILIVLNALAWGLTAPRLWATGTLATPNTLANLASGQQPLSVIDANFSAHRDYINARELTTGLFAARPAASVSGRYYFATDVNLGTLYLDTGSAWLQLAPGVTATTTYTNELASLTLLNASATNLNIAPGAAASDDTTFTSRILMTLTSDLVKLPDAAWAVGTNQGCLDTGTIGLGTYHLFVIERTDTAVVDALCSLSATSPTMPANYTKKRRVGAVIRRVPALRTENQIASFTQVNDEFLLNASILDVSVTNPGTSAVTRTLSVPTGIPVLARFNVVAGRLTTNYNLYLSSLDQLDEQASITAAPLSGLGDTNNGRAAGWFLIRTNRSAQVRSRQDLSGAGDTFLMATLGWIDYTRRN